jgi:hypothetical protein
MPMAEIIINLRTRRKAKERAAKLVQGTANAAKHGRTKALKALEAARAEREVTELDGHRMNRPAATGISRDAAKDQG